MAGSEKKVRGREPPIYTGAEDYEDWKLTVLSYLAVRNVRYIYLLDNYPKRRATAMAPLTEDVLKGHYDGGQATADVVMTLNQRLYFILLNNTSGSARQIVRAVTDFHGLEAMYQLGTRYGRTRAHETLTSMHKVMHMKVAKDDYEGHLLNWERERLLSLNYPAVKACLTRRRSLSSLPTCTARSRIMFTCPIGKT